MPKVSGAKLYVAAVFAAAVAMRATIGDSPLNGETAGYVTWALNGVCTGLGFILGPEIADGVKTVVGKLAGRSEVPESPVV